MPPLLTSARTFTTITGEPLNSKFTSIHLTIFPVPFGAGKGGEVFFDSYLRSISGVAGRIMVGLLSFSVVVIIEGLLLGPLTGAGGLRSGFFAMQLSPFFSKFEAEEAQLNQ